MRVAAEAGVTARAERSFPAGHSHSLQRVRRGELEENSTPAGRNARSSRPWRRHLMPSATMITRSITKSATMVISSSSIARFMLSCCNMV